MKYKQMFLRVFLLNLFVVLGMVSMSNVGSAAICSPGAAPECFRRSPLGSSYAFYEFDGSAITLKINEDGTAGFGGPTWGHPGGVYIYSRVDDFSFYVRLFPYGSNEPRETLYFEIADRGKKLLQIVQGGRNREFVRVE